jgi:hypothetical protein
MDLADLIEPGRVIFGAHANTKEKLLLDLASLAAASLNLDPKLVFNALGPRATRIHWAWRRVRLAARPN